MDRLIFSTPHGSRLYGLATPTSDLDVYDVYEGKAQKLYQKIVGDDDRIQGTLDGFLVRAMTGSHQSVEALFSNVKEYAPGMREQYAPMLDTLVITGGEVFLKYERTIRKFSYGDYKKRRHAARLSLNLQSLRDYGRFDPKLTELERTLCEKFAQTLQGDDLVAHLIR